jgi:phosphoglycerate kinase
MGDLRTLEDLGDVAGRTVLVRLDLNVPMHDGEVSDASRIERAVPTLEELLAKDARVVVLSHFGRPKGKRESSMSLKPLCGPLGAALGGRAVGFADDCVGETAERAVGGLKPGEVLLLENLRFHAGEEKNDKEFADRLARLGELYVGDAFSAAHRAHASITGLAARLPSAAGRLMQAEVEALSRALEAPDRPVAALVGGAKVSTKLELLGNLIEKVDLLILGGGMANTFLFAQGTPVGRSLCEKEMAGTAREVMAKAEARGCQILLPIDGVVASEFKQGAAAREVPIELTPDDGMILDVGSGSTKLIGGRLGNCRTLVWNGPLGAFEIAPFDAGTTAVARLVAERTQAGKLMSVAGGGDTLAALAKAGVLDQLSYVSTAGGAFLEWLEGKELPGVAALRGK